MPTRNGCQTMQKINIPAFQTIFHTCTPVRNIYNSKAVILSLLTKPGGSSSQPTQHPVRRTMRTPDSELTISQVCRTHSFGPALDKKAQKNQPIKGTLMLPCPFDHLWLLLTALAQKYVVRHTLRTLDSELTIHCPPSMSYGIPRGG